MTITNVLKESELYRCSDLALATAIALYFPLEVIEYQHNSSKAFFIFKRNSELDTFIEAYWKRELKIEPQAYFDQLKLLKTRLYEGGFIR